MHPLHRAALSLALVALPACQDQGLTTHNAAPEATIVFPEDGAERIEGELLTLQGVASDPDHDETDLAVRWTSEGAELCPTAAPDAYGGTNCAVVLDPGEVVVTLEVRDPIGAVGTDTVSFTVVPTEAPEAAILAPETGDRFYADQWIELLGQVADAEDPYAALTARWVSDLDGEVAGDLTPDDGGQVLAEVRLSEGAHQVELWVEDSSGKQGHDSVAFTVGPANSPPTCAITAPADGSAGAWGSPVAFAATVGDPDIAPGDLAVTWSSDLDGELGRSTPNTDGAVSFTTAALGVGHHVITLDVRDEMGLGCTDQVQYAVGTPPVVEIVAPTSGTVVDEGVSVAFEARVGDGEEPASGLSLAWSSDLDGPLSTAGADSAGLATFATAALSRGDHAIRLVATDTDGLWAQDLVSLTVNGLPTAPVISLGPRPATTRDDLVVTLESPSTDPDGDPVGYAWAWAVDGVASLASTSDTLPASATSRGQLWEVTVTPTDGTSWGPGASASLTIANSAPTVTAVAIAPTTAYTGTTLAASVSGADDDGDTVSWSYAWAVDGSFVYGGGPSLDGALWFDKHDDVAVTVTPNDGTDDGSPMTSAAVTIRNTPPGAPGVGLLPASPAEGEDDLVCSVTAASHDDDGDPVDYSIAWTVDGAPYPGAADTADTAGWLGPSTGTLPDDTVPAEDTREGETWTCTVTPDDGDDPGTAGRASVVIGPPESDDYSGTWLMDRTARYSCAYGLVSVNFSTLTIVDAYPSIVVTGGSGSQPGTMRGSFSSATAFSASNVLPGTCTETYTVTGTFLDPATLGATFEARFTGSMCLGCSYYSTTFTAVR